MILGCFITLKLPGADSAVDYGWVNGILDKQEFPRDRLLSIPIYIPMPFVGSPRSVMGRFQGHAMIPPQTSTNVEIRVLEYRGRKRCNLYKTAVRMAENTELRRLLTNDLNLLNLAITSREHQFKTSHESHLALMDLQNQRSLAENSLLILSNRSRVLVLQGAGLAAGHSFPNRLPVIVSLTAPVFSKPKALVGRNAQLRMLKPTDGISKQFAADLTMEVVRLIAEINNLASKYAVFSDELQLRRQESVAAAIAGAEAGRLSLADVLAQKRLLIQDSVAMTKIRRRQHELLADLVYLAGAESYQDLLKTRQ